MATVTVTETNVERTARLVLSAEGEGSCFSMGEHTLSIPMRMHRENREKLLSRFKDVPENSVILLQGGKQKTRHATDHEPIFRQESYFQYLFGVMEPDCYGAIHVGSKKSILFIPRLPPAYAVWMGEIKPAKFFKDHYEVDEVRYVDELEAYLEEGDPEKLFLLQGKNTDSGLVNKPAALPNADKYKEEAKKDTIDLQKLHRELSECRVIKSPLEQEVMRYVCRISSEAHVAVMQACKPGMYEYQMESLFRHHSYSKGGCRNLGYTCICGAGINSATLHYGHAGAPNDRLVKETDMCLLDMGAEYHCYGADITCSYPADGKFSAEQRDVYEAVLAGQQAVIAALKPGVNYVDMHKLAEREMLTVLRDRGYLRGDVEEMMEARVGALFQPHGLGHFLGIDTHDVGGYPEGAERSTQPGLKSLRMVRDMEPGMVLTVEPGIYFIRALLEPALQDPAVNKFLVSNKIEAMLDFGGVRLEDDILITEDGCENLTVCPRTVEEVEAVMAGGPWPRPA
mmetsp:Transcript_19431/g.74606  ORF Transcript_19431/g.74606 Transcript_19431/m.74606 type:complete len:512 (+) Transcript_19431:25-1560(+)